MNKYCFGFCVAALISTAAKAGGFDGPFVQIGVGGAATYNKVTASEMSSGASLNGTQSGTSFNGLVSAGYSKDMGGFNDALRGFNLAANLFYVIGNQNAGSNSSNGSIVWNGVPSTSTLSGSYRLENTWGLSLEPGFNLSESFLMYAKLAWVNSSAKSNVTNTDYDPVGSDNGVVTMNGANNINGFGYGVGAKYLVTKNIFVGIDVMGINYGNSFKNNQNGGYQAGRQLIGNQFSQFLSFASVGYKF